MVENQQNLDNKEANKDNIEDPSVVAQRFLNIFRQLHVFTAERKKAFDDMILAQPPEVRSTFGKLIGGTLLQEYVDELEKKSGVASSRDISTSIKDSSAEDKKAEQILAKALETTQKTSQVSSQAQMQQLQLQAQLLEAVKNIPAQGSAPIDAKNLEEIVASIMKSQTELITNVTKAQTEQLSKLIAASLQESYRHSTQSILETIKIMNKDSLEILRENFKLYANNNTPIILSNYNVSNPSGHSQISPEKISENTKTQEIVYERAPAEFYYEEKKEAPVEAKRPEVKETIKKDEVLSDNKPNSDAIVQEEDVVKKKKKKKKNKNKNNEQLQERNSVESAPTPVLDYSLFDSDDNNVLIKEETSTDKDEDILEDLDNDDLIDFTSGDIDLSDLGDVEEKVPAHKSEKRAEKKPKEEKSEDKKTNDKKESSFIANISKFIKNAKEEESKQKEKSKISIDELAPKKETPKAEYLEEKEYISDKTTDEAWEWVEEESSPENISSNEEWEWAEEENEQPIVKVDKAEEDEGEWEWVEEENTPQEASQDEEWEWVEEEPEQPVVKLDKAEDDEGEWEWVEEEPEQPVVKADKAEDNDEGEWEWIEEEEENDAVKKVEETKISAAEEDKAINDQDKPKENWEWEYEEIPEEVSLVDQEPITFEEEYVEPEGEERKKPAPISSDGIIDKESIFKFDDDNYVDVYKQDEDINIPPPSVPDPIQKSNAASTKEYDSIEPEDYWRLEEPENEELMIIDGNYDDLNINTNEDNLIEGLETVDNSIFKDEDENIDNLYAVAK